MSTGELSAVFRIREFRFVWFAELFSIAGDQLARVALAVLVYGRTGSASWAAATYALTFLPALLGGVLLSWPADQYRRREVMIASDVLRTFLVAAMAIPELSLWVLFCLLVVTVLLGSPFTAAQGAILPQVLHGDLYERGLAVRQITSQTAQLAGFAGGGLLVAAISPRLALLGNAVTFLLSAVLIRAGVVDRPRPRPDTTDGPGTTDGADTVAPSASADRLRGMATAIAAIATDPRRRALVLLAWLVGWYVVPEALAAPYADQLGSGPATVGMLMAADPLGSVIGAWLFMRIVPDATRTRLVGVLAVAAGIPLMLCLFRPGLPLTLVLWGVSGMSTTAYMLQVQASFVRATADTDRGRAIGVAASGIIAAQGIAMLIGGLLADLWDPATAIAVAGATGALLSLACAVAWHLANRPLAGIASTSR
jgi:predicted MFS family arabinose efflux permease